MNRIGMSLGLAVGLILILVILVAIAEWLDNRGVGWIWWVSLFVIMLTAMFYLLLCGIG